MKISISSFIICYLLSSISSSCSATSTSSVYVILVNFLLFPSILPLSSCLFPLSSPPYPSLIYPLPSFPLSLRQPRQWTGNPTSQIYRKNSYYSYCVKQRRCELTRDSFMQQNVVISVNEAAYWSKNPLMLCLYQWGNLRVHFRQHTQALSMSCKILSKAGDRTMNMTYWKS